MNKNRLMASGALLAIGAMLPITTGALTAAKVPPAPAPVVAATATAAPTPDCANLKPGDAWAGVSLHCGLGTPTAAATPSPEPTAVEPVPTSSSVAVGPAVQPGTVPAPIQTAPAVETAPTCPEGTLKAEDGSCVNDRFWDSPECQEDDPCWDCSTMGNQLCGVNPALLEDAWSSFDAESVANMVGRSIAFSATYVGTSGASSIPGYWAVRSLENPNTFHVFLIEPGK